MTSRPSDRAVLTARRRARRDRHGHGMRGPIAPPEVPVARTRSEIFDDLVLDAVEHLEPRWARELAQVEFVVEDVPPAEPPAEVVDAGDEVPLAATVPAGRGTPARIVIYRRPLEVRAPDRVALAGIVHDVVVERVADLLGLDPETVDPAD